MQSPKGLLLLFVGMALFMVPMLVVVHKIEHPAGPSLEEITITESKLSHYRDGRHIIAIIGKLKNTSARPGSQPHFEARFYNSDDELIDAVAEDVYGLVIPAGQEVGFRIRAEAQNDESQYASYEIHLTGIHGSRL